MRNTYIDNVEESNIKKDYYNRKIDYLRISVTDRCNLRCKYCMPKDGVHKLSHNEVLRHEEIINFVKIAASEGVKKIRLTGGEPLVRKGIVSLISKINDIQGIEEITITTNGLLLDEQIQELYNAGIQRVNISLDTLKPERFKEMTRGGELDQVLAGIKAAKEIGMTPIKINTVLIGGFNDDEIDDFMVFAKQFDLQWRVIELMPIGEVSEWSKDNFVNGQKIFDEHPMLIRKVDDIQGIEKRYIHKEFNIIISLIDALSGKFCESCNRLRLTSDGNIKPCLHSDLEIDIKDVVNDKEKLREYYHEAIEKKPKEHHINEDDYTPVKRNMNRIGG